MQTLLEISLILFGGLWLSFWLAQGWNLYRLHRHGSLIVKYDSRDHEHKNLWRNRQ